MMLKCKKNKSVTATAAEPSNLTYAQRVVRVVVSVLIIGLTGMSVSAADPLQQLMKLGGAYTNYPLNEQARSTAFIMDVGLSCSLLFGILADPINRALGLKISNVLGISLHSLGWIFFIFTRSHLLYLIGAVSFGLAFQLLVTCNIASAGLIPEKEPLIMGCIMAACDFSLLIPHFLLILSHTFSVYTVVSMYLIFVVGGVAVLGVIFIPTKQILFETGSLSNSDETKQLLTNEKHSLIPSQHKGHEETMSDKFVNSESEFNIYHSWDFKKQILTKEYWLILIYFLVAFLRKKYMSVNIREIFKEIDGDKTSFGIANLLSDIFCYVVPYGFVFTLIWTLVMTRLGLTLTTCILNGLCCIYLLLLQVPAIKLQALTVALYIICQAFVYAHFLAQLTYFFGIKTLSASQGTASFITGSICLLLDTFLMPALLRAFGTYRFLNMVYLMFSIGLFACPLALMPRKQKLLRIKDDFKV